MSRSGLFGVPVLVAAMAMLAFAADAEDAGNSRRWEVHSVQGSHHDFG